MTSAVDTSIVLATCSRALMLQAALDSLIAQDWALDHAVELIVVDDNSTDDTAEVLTHYQLHSSIPLIVLRGRSQGVAAARNLGCAAARGAWIASFDDDQIALPGWLRQLRLLAQQTGAATVGGCLNLQYPEGASPDAFGPRARSVLGEHDLGPDALQYGRRHLPSTNNVLLRSDVFQALHGYDTSFTEGGEDTDFFSRVQAAGLTQWYQPISRALHVMTHSRLERKNLRWTSLRLGASDVRIQQRKSAFLGPLRLAAFRIAIALLRDFPQFTLAAIRFDRRAQLDAACSLWYTQGFLRALLPILSARTANSNFLRSVDFRARNGERNSRTVRNHNERSRSSLHAAQSGNQ
jgi:GT2 family glycosyltransferase